MAEIPSATPIAATVQDDVLLIRLAAPARRNAIDCAFTSALADVLDLGLDRAGAVAIGSDGAHFCVGGDVRAMAASSDRSAFVAELAALHASLLRLQAGPPVVVGVRGWAAGAGMSLVGAGDVVVAGRSTMLQPAYPAIGLTPDSGMSWNLPRIVGPRQARSLILRNTVIDATTALELGIADEIVADGDVERSVLDQARSLAAGPRNALHDAKQLLLQAAVRSYDDQLAAESASISRSADSVDGAEGIAAFGERRHPVFGSQPR